MTTMTEEGRALLSRLVGMMIPECLRQDLPRVDDTVILGKLLTLFEGVKHDLSGLLATLVVAISSVTLAELLELLRKEHAVGFDALCLALAQSYFHDDRVMAGHDIDARAFPKGFELDNDDRSILDPVKARGPIWRRADA